MREVKVADSSLESFMPAEEWKPVKVGEVCIVTEISVQNGSESLYGLWESERAARHDYGDEGTAYKVRYETFPLWGMRHVG
jgi:hypothetical protein